MTVTAWKIEIFKAVDTDITIDSGHTRQLAYIWTFQIFKVIR